MVLGCKAASNGHSQHAGMAAPKSRPLSHVVARGKPLPRFSPSQGYPGDRFSSRCKRSFRDAGVPAAPSCQAAGGLFRRLLLGGESGGAPLKRWKQRITSMTENRLDRASRDGWFQAGAISSSKNQPRCVAEFQPPRRCRWSGHLETAEVRACSEAASTRSGGMPIGRTAGGSSPGSRCRWILGWSLSPWLQRALGKRANPKQRPRFPSMVAKRNHSTASMWLTPGGSRGFNFVGCAIRLIRWPCLPLRRRRLRHWSFSHMPPANRAVTTAVKLVARPLKP